MPRNVTTTAVAKYGDFKFPAPIITTFLATPNYGRDGRKIISRTYRIGIQGTLTDEDFSETYQGHTKYSIFGASVADPLNSTPFEEKVKRLRRVLGTEGLYLSFTGFGYGTILLDNASLTRPDVNFGPKPGELNLRTWGPFMLYYQWEVEVTLVEDCVYSPGSGFLSEFGYFGFSVEISMDENNVLQRTIQVSAETLALRNPATAAQNVVTPSSRTIGGAGSYTILRDILNGFPTIEGYKRSQSDSIGPDHRTLEVTIIDREINSNNPYWPGCSNMQLSHRASTATVLNSGIGSGIRLVNNLSGTIDVFPGISKTVAWQAFATVLINRLRFSQQGQGTIKSIGIPAVYPVIQSLDVEEQIYGRSMSFSCTWWFTCALQDFFVTSGLMSPLNVGNWFLWKQSLDSNRQRMLDLVSKDEDDVIVGFCTSPKDQPLLKAKKDAEQKASPLANNCPPADKSWLNFQALYHKVSVLNSARVPLLKKPPPGFPTGGPGTSTSDNTATQFSPDVGMYRGGYTENYIIFEGQAIRVGHLITIPTIKKIGDQIDPPIIEKHDMQNIKIGSMGGCPVYYSRWRYKYYAYSLQKGEKIKTDGIPKGFEIQDPTSPLEDPANPNAPAPF